MMSTPRPRRRRRNNAVTRKTRRMDKRIGRVTRANAAAAAAKQADKQLVLDFAQLILDSYSELDDGQLVERQRCQQEWTQVREEQDRELELALRADRRERERLESLFALQESAAARCSKQRAERCDGDAPPPPQQQLGLLHLTLVLPSGQRCEQRFASSSCTLSELFRWAMEEYALAESDLLDEFVLLVPGFPARRLSLTLGKQLASSHVSDRTLLRVEKL
eukprot:CAMPEP_0177648272 /NCGR_PEP_ID=MMETSP0447-20121125/10742_1 /TAXON_ID=0 /ORGANISM="Stygamoeba regulata, Strain BSH-02190019" /LENGTH=220 /DNA_ID=CAMNT_0019150907 /DNA_START=139 /DNA_END=801 /DNA_ORIENTATION=-